MRTRMTPIDVIYDAILENVRGVDRELSSADITAIAIIAVRDLRDEFPDADLDGTASRVAAFGAIRRAATVARRCAAASKASLQDRRPDDAYAQRSSAHAIRYAIRAAIGSEKA